MTYQAITEHTSPNQNTRPKGAASITSITIHHWGIDGQKFDPVVKYLCRPGGNSSAHYVVQDGTVACIVAPERRAWHAGTKAGNDSSIGIECRPEATDGDYATVAQLVRELRAVYGDLPLKRHSDWKATACPGRWDLPRLDRLARQTPAPAPAPTTHKRKTGDPVIYRHSKERTPFGIYGANGGFVELSTAEERTNLLKAGVPEVWLAPHTVTNLIADARA